ncbi:MAG: hypothetical protein PWQ42_296, partial [Sulfurospirillum sp.]|nr:hypothetical protein [Sulfurospirillum sp.]
YIALILVVIHENMAQKVMGILEYFFIAFTIVLMGYRIYFQKSKILHF